MCVVKNYNHTFLFVKSALKNSSIFLQLNNDGNPKRRHDSQYIRVDEFAKSQYWDGKFIAGANRFRVHPVKILFNRINRKLVS